VQSHSTATLPLLLMALLLWGWQQYLVLNAGCVTGRLIHWWVQGFFAKKR
jgi:hypothetical protein